MKIIDALPNITSVPHVFETPDDIIINSQIYDKHTLKPKEFCFFNFNNVLINFNLLNESISRVGDKTCLPDKGVDYSHIIQDNQDNNIFYILWQALNSPSSMLCSKIQKTESSYKILNTVEFGGLSPYNNRNSYKFLCQTKEFIFLCEEHTKSINNYNDLNCVRIRRVNKDNFTSVFIGYYESSNVYNSFPCFATSFYLIKQDNAYLYLYMQFGETSGIHKYNINNNTIQTLYTFNANYNSIYCIGVSNIISFNNKYYIISTSIGHAYYALIEINISNTDAVSIKEYIISHSNFAYSSRGFREYENVSYAITPYLVYTLKNINNEYIGLTVHSNEGFGITTNQKHMVIKYNNNNNAFEITDCKTLPICYGVLYYNNTTSVVLTQQGFTFYVLQNDKWVSVYTETGTFYYIGFDEYKRFYTIDSSNNVKIHSNISTVKIDCNFIDNNYEYIGSDINTQCYVYAKNFLNEYISTTIKVTLSGPVTFSNGLKEKYVTTNKLSPSYEDIVIKGSGKIEINAIEE